MTDKQSEIEIISQRIDNMVTVAREDLAAAIDENYDWAMASGQALRLSDLLRVRSIIAEYQQ